MRLLKLLKRNVHIRLIAGTIHMQKKCDLCANSNNIFLTLLILSKPCLVVIFLSICWYRGFTSNIIRCVANKLWQCHPSSKRISLFLCNWYNAHFALVVFIDSLLEGFWAILLIRCWKNNRNTRPSDVSNSLEQVQRKIQS